MKRLTILTKKNNKIQLDFVYLFIIDLVVRPKLCNSLILLLFVSANHSTVSTTVQPLPSLNGQAAKQNNKQTRRWPAADVATAVAD